MILCFSLALLVVRFLWDDDEDADLDEAIVSAATGAAVALEDGESSWNGFGMSLRPTDGNDFSCGGCLGGRVDGFIPYHNTKSDGTYYYVNSQNPNSYYYNNCNGSYYCKNADGSSSTTELPATPTPVATSSTRAPPAATATAVASTKAPVPKPAPSHRDH
ncbi:hypothetical protein CPB97_004001 [Podila verticillata]|nr:hypothetical protein CPB97_004001 [Podila verticillata]